MNNTIAVPYAALLLRLSLGTMALAHGALKIFVFTLPGTVGYFESLGLPGFTAYAVVAAEVLGGAALIAGVQVRWAALGLIPVLLGATFVHVGNGWVFSGANGGWEFPAFWTLTLAVQALLGGGAWQLQDVLGSARVARA
jgi:putative oxidoreductase